MEYRSLGKTGLRASVIGFGCNRIAAASNDRAEVVATLESAVDLGINFFDTADSYDDGESERLLGRVLQGRRDRILICSKAGYRSWIRIGIETLLPPLSRLMDSRKRHPRKTPPRQVDRRSLRNFSPRFLALAVEGSLRRLRTDYLDFFYLHSPPAAVIADARVFEALERLKRLGRIRHYGISFAERTPTSRILEWLEESGISILQFQVNPGESVHLPTLLSRASTDVAVIARQPFHRGTLLDLPIAISARTQAQTLLRSVLQQEGIHSVLVGMRSRKHLEENLGALGGPSLSAEEMEHLYSSARFY